MNIFRNFKILLAAALVWGLSSAGSVYAVSLGSGFSPSTVNPGDYSILSMYVFNDSNAQLTNVGWTNNLPADMTIQSSPAITTDCGGTLTATPGTSTMSLTGGIVAPQSQCTVSVPVRSSLPPNSVSVNAVPALTLTSSPYYTNSAFEATLTINIFAAPTLSTSLSRSLIYLGEDANLTISVINTDVTKTLTQTGWAHTLPTGLQVNGVATDNGNCGTPAITATTGTTAIALSAATIAPNASCTITIPITGNAQGNYSIDLPVGAITSYQNATNASPSSQSIAVQSFSASKAFNPASVKTNQVSTMSISITSKAPYSNLAFTDDFHLQTGLVVAPTPNAVVTGAGCSGTVTANPGSQVVSLSNGVIPAGGTFLVPMVCTVSVDVVVPSNLNIGIKTNTMAIGSIASGTASNINVASAALTVTGYTAPTLTQSLSTTTSFVGQVINLLVNVKNNDATTFTNVGWVDTLPAGLVATGVAPSFSAGCTGTRVANLGAGNTQITLSGASIAQNATCTVTIPVTANQQGTITVPALPVSSVTNDQGTSNILPAAALSLTASTFTVVQKLNGATPTATMSLNTATKLRIEITNKSTDTYSNLTFTDNFIASGSNLPATFTLINPANAVTTCNATGALTTITNGGAITGFTTGSTAFTFSGGFLAAGTATNVTTTCYVELDVQATAVITNRTNAISTVTALADGTGILTSGLNTAASATVANLTISAAAIAAPTVTTKTLSATATMGSGAATRSAVVGSGISYLQISVKNNDASTTLTNVTWTDTFPAGMVWTGGAITYSNCGTGSVTFDVSNSIATLGGGASIAPGLICNVLIPVKATQQGVFANTIPINAAAGSVSNDQGVHNAATPTATLTSTSITATKAFRNLADTAAVTSIHIGDTAKLKITITNPSTTEGYTSLALTDSFVNYVATVGGTPALQIAATPNAMTTCVAGGALTALASVGGSAVAGAQSVSLAGGTLAANSSCYVIVDVTGIALMATKANTIAAGTAALSTGAGITAISNSNATQIWNAAAVTANLSVIAIVPPTISTKTFTPTSVVVGSGVSTLKISVKNNDLTAPLTNVGWTDIFPAGVVATGGAITYLNCGAGTVAITTDAITGIQTATLSGVASLAPGAICDASIPVKATMQGVFTNTILAGAITKTETTVSSVAKSGTTPLTSTSITSTKAFRNMLDTLAVTTMHVGDTFKLKITINNPSTTESYNSLSFTDNFATFIATVGGTPALQIAAIPNANTTCTAGSVLTPLSGLAGSSAVAGSQSITLASGVLGVGVSSCYVIVDVTALAAMTVKANTIAAGTAALSTGAGITALSNNNASQIWNTAAPTANLTITPLAAPTFSAKNFLPTSVFMGQSSTLTISVTNNDAITTLNNVSWTDTFPSGLVVAGTPTATKTAPCGAATFTPLAGATSLVFSGGVIAPGATCTITVNVTGTTLAGSYTNSIPIGAITTTEGISNTVASPAPALWLAGVTMTKAFSVSPLAVGGTSRLTINVNNNTTVIHPSIALTDDFSAQTGLVIANPPNVVSSGTGCTLGTVTAVAGTSVVSLSGFALAAGTQALAKTCTVQVDVVGNISGAKTNTIYGDNVLHPGLGLVALPSQFTTDATAPLTVSPATLTVAKTFTTSPVTAPVSIRANGTDVALMRITVTNPNLLSVNSMSFTDTFPVAMAGMVISNAAAPVNTCGGTLTATVGSNAVSFSGTVADTLAPAASCYIEVPVVSTTAFMNRTNSVSVTAKTSMAEIIAPVTATANLTAHALSVTHAFGTASLIVSTNTAWTVTIVNNSATMQTAVAFSDTFTSVAANALFVAPVPTVANSCGGTVTATAGTNVVSLTGGTIPANSSCTISVNMVGNGVGTITNNAVSVTSSQQTTAATSNNASLVVINPSVLINTVSKVFTPPTVTLLQNSTASITWSSASAGDTVNPIVTDNLPVGMTVAASTLLNPTAPNVMASCATGAQPTILSTTVSPLRNQIVVALSITQVQNQVCTITFEVTPTQPGTLTNTIAKGDILSADGTTAANTVASNNAQLVVTNVLTIGKTFQPTDLSFSGVAMLTITVTNPEAIPLTGASLRDNLPATTPNDLIVAGAPYTTAVATTDCTADGSQSTALVTAVAGTRIIQLTGGVIPSKQGAVDGVCHITVPVKLGSASPTGPATNTIPIGTGVVGTGLTSTEGRFNINAASATINFVAPTLGIGKAFSPASVTGGSVSRLTVTINNQNNFIQTGLAFTDNMPTGMTVGAPADPQTTCTGGTFTGAATGSASWSFSGGVVAASGSCTVSLNVTMNVRNVLTNTIPVNALTSANGGKNTLQGAANLNNLAGVSIAKAFTPNPAVVNQPIRLTFTITNASDTPLTQLGFVDDLTLGGTQTGLTVSPTPNISGNCGGGTVVASGTSITLSNGFLGVDSACSILVDVMTDTARSYVNTVPIHAITSLEGKTNAAAGTDTLPVYVGIRAVKQLSPTSDAGRFVLTLSPAAPSGVSSRTNVGHDATPSAVASFFATEGTTYTVTETGQGATSLANYLTTWACRNADNTLLASGSGAAATVTAPITAGGATKNQQDISCTFTNVNKIALVTVNSVSNGGVGSFTFTGTNGLPISATTITTTTAGVSATTAVLTEVVLSSKGVATVITDGALSGGFVLSGASCTGLQGGDTATLVGSVLTIPSTSIVDGARISCTFTHLLPSAKTLTLRKQWVGATLNDAVNITATGLTSLASIATTAGKLDTGTAQSVSNGAVITIAEAFSVGSALNYTATLACTGTTGLSGNVLTVGVADGAIVCTQTNTFTGAGGSRITGTVFKDTGASSGTANNGVQEGAELGIAGVTITANQASCASTVCGTAITDGAGNYTLVLPSTVTGVITLTETNLNGMLSTGGSAGTSAGTYTRSTDTVTAFNVVAGTTYTGLNFGDVPDNQFVTDGVQTALPGSMVFYPHYFVAGTTGSVAFSYTKSSSPALTGWSELIYVDANCDGVIGAADVLVAASVALTADQKVCLLVKQFVPANVPVNAQNALTLTALFTSTFANPSAEVSFSYVRHDTTTVGQPTAAGLSLVKQVNTPTASPGTNIVYTVVYTNSSTGPLSNVVIHDATPAYTTFQSANCGTLPLNFTACSITNPAVGASGSIIYTFTGTLAPAASGAVTFTVQVQP